MTNLTLNPDGSIPTDPAVAGGRIPVDPAVARPTTQGGVPAGTPISPDKAQNILDNAANPVQVS